MPIETPLVPNEEVVLEGAETRHTLTIVIPALNEEEAIGSTLSRCLDACPYIQSEAGLAAVEVIVVSDGSTDRTAEIASEFDGVKVIVFPHNRGYGAAIKEGWRQGTGDLLGFMDADGTCDPRNFGPLCIELLSHGADITLGSRLGPDSQMPPVRKFGNRCYALLLGWLCGRSITDTASGMRVLRRDALGLLFPLPDGLHFTPAMSAHALLGGLRIVEVPMSYTERIGTSKLRALADGIRFFRVIIGGVLRYRPERLFLMGFALCLLFSLFLAAYPAEFYFKYRYIEEWMIYRFLACFLLGGAGYLLLCAGVLAHQMALLAPRSRDGSTFWPPILVHAFRGKPLVILTTAEVAISVSLLWRGIVEYVTTGHVYIHWSHVVVGAFGLLIAFESLVTWVLLLVVDVLRAHRNASMPGPHG